MPHHRRDLVRDVALVAGGWPSSPAWYRPCDRYGGRGPGILGEPELRAIGRHLERDSHLPGRGDLHRPDHGRARHRAPAALPTDLAAHGYVEQEFFASGTAHAFTATVDAVRRPVAHRAHHRRLLPHEDPGPPPGGPGALQRHGGRRVDERLRRRVGARLGLPQSRADGRTATPTSAFRPRPTAWRAGRRSSVSSVAGGRQG